MGEEMLDLLKDDWRHILVGHNVRIIREGLIDGHAEQFFITASIVFHHQNANRAAFDHRTGDDRRTRDDKCVQRVAIFTQCVRNKAIIGGVTHGGVQETVYEKSARSLVKFILYRFTANGNLDQHVQAFRHIVACWNQINTHGRMLSNGFSWSAADAANDRSPFRPCPWLRGADSASRPNRRCLFAQNVCCVPI